MRSRKLLLLLLSVVLIAAIKPRFGGEVTLRLNEPASTDPSPSGYSGAIFTSLLYENFFFFNEQGEVDTHLFHTTDYNPQTRTLSLRVRENLSFSDGSPLTSRQVAQSLKVFLGQDLLTSSRLNRLIRGVRAEADTVKIELIQDTPTILEMLAAPELVVVSDQGRSFSGPFAPGEWVKGQSFQLKANPFHPGGRPFLDSVRLLFTDDPPADIFLATPGKKGGKTLEMDAGVYQSAYLVFPQPGTTTNTQVALTSFLRQFFTTLGPSFRPLDSLISDAESPVIIRVKTFPEAKMKSLLRYADIKLYALVSLRELEEPFRKYCEAQRVKIELLFVEPAQLTNIIKTSGVRFLMIDKTWQRKTPVAEKVARVIRETTFTQFDEKYLRLLNELDETARMGDEKFVMEQVARVMTQVVEDGFILPVFQRNYSLYIREGVSGITLDPLGRPRLLGLTREAP